MKSWSESFERRARRRKRQKAYAEELKRREEVRKLAQAGGLLPRHHYAGFD